MVGPALQAARRLDDQGLSLGVVNARFAKPVDETLIGDLIASGKPLVVCEDHSAIGGFGAAVLELASGRGLDAANVRLLGLPDRFIAHASRRGQLKQVGLDATGLEEAFKDLVDKSA